MPQLPPQQPPRRWPNSTQLKDMGFTANDLAPLSPRVRKLTRTNLIELATEPQVAPRALKLTFEDLQSLQTLAAKTQTGGGGSGDGGIRCCCCIACCCCCCAVSVEPSAAVA